MKATNKRTIKQAGDKPVALPVFALVLISFLLVSLGIFITINAPNWGRSYWLVLSVVFSAISLVWKLLKHKNHHDHFLQCLPWRQIIVQHVLFWIAIWAAMVSVYFAWRFGMINIEASGIINLLIVAIAVYADGLWVDKHFSFFGAILLLLAITAVFARAYMWLGFVFVVIYGLYWVIRGLAGSRHPPHSSA